MYTGIGASSGIGIGKVRIVKQQNLSFQNVKAQGFEIEKRRFIEAREVFLQRTEKMAELIRQKTGEKEAEILEGQLMMIQDPAMEDEINKLMKADKCAEESVAAICDMFIMMFTSADDELTNQRATDVNDIKMRMLGILLGAEDTDLSCLQPETILVVHDLTPSMTAEMDKSKVIGILTEIGGITSHSAILARALGIPAVLGIDNIVNLVEKEASIVMDGSTGEVHVNPSEAILAEFRERQIRILEEKEGLQKFKGKVTETADHVKVDLVCNIGKPEEVNQVIKQDGEGIGLFRTEFLFMDRDCMPTEEEQFEAYRKVVEELKGKPVIIRTLDVGGDKEITYLNMPKEDNPFLGFRAIRYCLKNLELYSKQLRALIRASHYGDIRIMVPLVTCVEEIREVKKVVREIQVELEQRGIPFNEKMQVGVMMETPAACQISDLLSKEADFFSIGTNDLTSYTMSADRGNANVSYLNSFYHPAVLRSIRTVIENGQKQGIMVGMCGEAAGAEKMIPLLLAFGLQEFSVSAISVLRVRSILSKWTMEQAKKLADKVMQASTEAEVHEILEKIRIK